MEEEKQETLTLADIRSRFILYPTDREDLFTGSYAIEFNGSSKEFISTAVTLGIKIIYLPANFTSGSMDNTPVDKIGFLRDGFMHVFSSEKILQAPEKSPKLATPVSNSDPISRVKQNPDDEARNMALWVKSNLNYMSPDSFNLQYFFTKYWNRLGIDRTTALNSGDRSIIEEVERLATSKIKTLK